MARTPLLQALQRALAEHRRARALGLSLEAFREASAEHRLRRAGAIDEQRRSVLLGAAGLAAGGLLTPATASSREKPSIAIVGAGIAGLNCALCLQDVGLPSTVYEASGRVGGRMFSNNRGFWDQDQVTEWGGELIDSGHTTIRRLARRFDLKLDNLLDAEPSGSTSLYWLDNGYYPRASAVADFAPVFDALTADLDAAPFPTLYNSYTAAGLALDQLSVRDWIESRVPGGNASALGRILDLAYSTEYGAPTDEQSSLNLIYLLGYQPDPADFSDFGESDERFHIRGGNQRLPEAIADALPEESIRHHHRLTRVARASGKRYRLDFDTDAGPHSTTVDLVVLALPFAVLAEVDCTDAGFSALKRTAITELGRGVSGKLQLQFDQRYWTGSGPWPLSNGATYADLGYQQTWEVTRAQPGAAGILNFFTTRPVTTGFATHLPFATSQTPEVQQDAAGFLALIDRVYPGIAAHWNGKATQSIPHRSRYFRASYSYYRVGQYTRFGGYERHRQDGVYFCGEHTSTEAQGYMEGGAETGARAARDIIRRLI